MSKETVKAYKENEMFELIQEAVEDLHRVADRLEKYANEHNQVEPDPRGSDNA